MCYLPVCESRTDSKLLEGRGKQGKEASVKLGGPGPLFEGFGPLRRQKGVQQQAKEARTSWVVRDPFLKDSDRSEGKKRSSNRKRHIIYFFVVGPPPQIATRGSQCLFVP